MDKDEFYIGWQDHAASSYKQGRRKFFIISLFIILLFGTGYLFLENKFVDNYFDYGNLTKLEGTVVEYPVFGLKTKIDGLQVTVPLVGFGKFDALPVLEEIKKQTDGAPLNSLIISLEGTLFRYQGKTWMELTEGNNSIISIHDAQQHDAQTLKHLGTQSIAGEIVDPKCFFGVMNPAYNKIHRSCAIRCISGGIPPVLAIRENGIFTDYYFVTNGSGHSLNQSILQYVGMPLTLSGEVEQVDDWKLIKIHPNQVMKAVAIKLDTQLELCATR